MRNAECGVVAEIYNFFRNATIVAIHAPKAQFMTVLLSIHERQRLSIHFQYVHGGLIYDLKAIN